MTSLTAIKKALTDTQIQAGTVVQITATTVSISTTKGVIHSAPIPGIKKGDRVTIKQGVITPINAQNAPVFHL